MFLRTYLPSTPTKASSTLKTGIGAGSLQAISGFDKVCLSTWPTTSKPLWLPMNLRRCR